MDGYQWLGPEIMRSEFYIILKNIFLYVLHASLCEFSKGQYTACICTVSIIFYDIIIKLLVCLDKNRKI